MANVTQTDTPQGATQVTVARTARAEVVVAGEPFTTSGPTARPASGQLWPRGDGTPG